MKDDLDKTGGPAITQSEDYGPVWNGLTKRDWFAGMALQGIVIVVGNRLGQSKEVTVDSMASDAYDLAGAMIRRRAQ
jgi:hypothetical protein